MAKASHVCVKKAWVRKKLFLWLITYLNVLKDNFRLSTMDHLFFALTKNVSSAEMSQSSVEAASLRDFFGWCRNWSRLKQVFERCFRCKRALGVLDGKLLRQRTAISFGGAWSTSNLPSIGVGIEILFLFDMMKFLQVIVIVSIICRWRKSERQWRHCTLWPPQHVIAYTNPLTVSHLVKSRLVLCVMAICRKTLSPVLMSPQSFSSFAFDVCLHNVTLAATPYSSFPSLQELELFRGQGNNALWCELNHSKWKTDFQERFISHLLQVYQRGFKRTEPAQTSAQWGVPRQAATNRLRFFEKMVGSSLSQQRNLLCRLWGRGFKNKLQSNRAKTHPETFVGLFVLFGAWNWPLERNFSIQVFLLTIAEAVQGLCESTVFAFV